VEKVNRREEKKMEMKGFRKHRLNIEMYMCWKVSRNSGRVSVKRSRRRERRMHMKRRKIRRNAERKAADNSMKASRKGREPRCLLYRALKPSESPSLRKRIRNNLSNKKEHFSVLRWFTLALC
jgi:hypothetical protein